MNNTKLKKTSENIYKELRKKGIDVIINEAETVAIVGDNGAGKSTLIKILTGVFLPDKGRIFLRGKETRFTSPKDARNNGIETVYQEQALADELSVERNLFMGREPRKPRGLIRLLDLRKMKEDSERILSDLGLSNSSVE